MLNEARAGYGNVQSWKLVKGLVPRLGAAREKDEAALRLAAPESGSFVLVSLRRRRRDRILKPSTWQTSTNSGGNKWGRGALIRDTCGRADQDVCKTSKKSCFFVS